MSDGALSLHLTLRIISVRNFDLVGFKIDLDMILVVEWKDIRLNFFNLRDSIFSNRVTFSVVSGNRVPAETLPSTPLILQVRREHAPLPDDTTSVTKDEIFDGTNNPLVLRLPISITLNCQFYLRTYPFDDQQCTFVYFLNNGNNVSFILNSVAFTGYRQLLEYEVVGTSGVVNNSAISSFSVVIKFTNQFGYYVGNAFLPSIFLVIICYLTFWFSLDDFQVRYVFGPVQMMNYFDATIVPCSLGGLAWLGMAWRGGTWRDVAWRGIQDRIMVSLTSLLVLTGLMTQTSQSIPKTAYLKLIDVWYIVLIFIDFLIIVVLAVIENLRQHTKSGEVKVIRSSNGDKQKAPFVWLPQPGPGVESKVNAISIVVFPLVCIIFIVVYFAIGLSYIAN
ncbi:Glycine receptor subunit alpha-2 [Portunus trituberculatus]|uniref:Glycine receptor subunit alpha-2 n=1 Tax=Portunus trituberculatus TaxID=210409 RepID=A0A5B7EGF6_PORTR|nr:Glycine receptor subunit alpha-2 [Portunus trituberculatus]